MALHTDAAGLARRLATTAATTDLSVAGGCAVVVVDLPGGAPAIDPQRLAALEAALRGAPDALGVFSNGSFIDFVTAMREELGDDVAGQWLADMADNDARVYANNNAIVEAVGRGEVPLANTANGAQAAF